MKLKLLLGITASLLLSCYSPQAAAQRVSLKTNALYWATASPNLGLEFRLNRHLTLDLEGAANRLTIGDNYSRIFHFSPEMRYWFSARPQAGHFVGLTGVAYNCKVCLSHKWHNGDAFGAGVTYGYSFVLSRHWSMETTLGLGLAHIREKKYDDVPPSAPNNSKWTLAPLKAGVTFVYILK